MITPEIAQRILGEVGFVRDISRLEKGHLRLETALLYPDGSSVDVFVKGEGPLLPLTDTVSDLGQTIAWLLDVQVKPWLSKKRQLLLEDALRVYGVRMDGGELCSDIAEPSQLPQSVLLLAQACIRVADLFYTRRSSMQLAFNEQVEEFIADTTYPYEPNATLLGRFQKQVKVDFLVNGPRRPSAMLALSANSSSAAHTLANEIFRRWYDLDVPERPEHRITVVDDSVDVYREDDLDRIRDKSDMVPFSDKNQLSELLAA